MKFRLAALALLTTQLIRVRGTNTESVPTAPTIGGGTSSAPAAASTGSTNRNSGSTNRDSGSNSHASARRTVVPLDVQASSTKVVHGAAIKLYNQFVNHQNEAAGAHGLPQSYKKFDELTEEDVVGPVLQNGVPVNPNNPPIMEVAAEFANFCLEMRKKDGSPYAPLSAAQFYSTWKAALFNKFKALAFRSECQEWYEQLYRGLKMRVTVECIKRGGKVTKKAVGMSKDMMKLTLLFLLKQENESLCRLSREGHCCNPVSCSRTWIRGRLISLGVITLG